MKLKKIISLLLAFVITVSFISACDDVNISEILGAVEEILAEDSGSTNAGSVEGGETVNDSTKQNGSSANVSIDENGTYTSKDDVALYIHIYGKLPNNFITKDEARELGWDGKDLDKYAPGKCIGGDYFGNYEGLLPEKKGRKYTECDIDTLGQSSRGVKRIVFSNDGLIYYTDDHYESFTLLYGEE